MTDKKEIINYIIKHKPHLKQKHLEQLNIEWLSKMKEEIDAKLNKKTINPQNES